MASTKDSGLGHVTNGSPQTHIDEMVYPAKVTENEATSAPRYVPRQNTIREADGDRKNLL